MKAADETVLELSGLSKRFGKIQAVNSLDLQVKKGMIFGMLGPNGSGKTTTLGMLLGVTIPDSGKFSWFGKGQGHHVRKQVGAILEKPVFYPYMSANQNLNLVCRIKDLPRTRVQEVLKVVGLSERANDPFKSYSLGMKQRLAIGSALLCDPEVMILDEPTNGLDPQGIADIRELIIQIASSGKTIILASHLLDEVQKVCSDFCVLSKGKMLYSGNVHADMNVGNSFDIACENMGQLKIELNKFANIQILSESKDELRIKLDDNMTSAQLNRELASMGIYLSRIAAGKKSLEQQFLQILQEHQS